ncbi:MAG: IS110 family transposase [Nocardioidaceae bacterium]|nr:IS110 family transposase [Nocardioidaceae bacterium]
MSSMTIPTGIKQEVFAGVDTHKATHHAAVIDVDGRLVQQRQFAATGSGCHALVHWLGQWQVQRVGVEQTGTYGAGLTRELVRVGHQVREVNQPDTWVRAMAGKSDPIDAVMAAEAARSGRAAVIPKDSGGVIESIRMLHAARRSAVKDRAVALTQIGALAITVPAALRERVGTKNRQIAAASLRLRPDRARISDPTQAAKVALRSLAERVHALDEQITGLDTDLAQLLASVAPRLLERPYVGVHAAAQLLVTAGQNIDRIGSEAKFARLTGTAPIPASSGQTHRMRLHRGGDRAANAAIHLVAVGRLRSHQPAIDYLARRTSQGLSKKDAIRAMKRLIARELYGALKADLRALDAI